MGALYRGGGSDGLMVCGCGLVVQLDGLPTDAQGNRIHGSHYSPSGVPVQGNQPQHAARSRLVLNQLIMNGILPDRARLEIFDTLNSLLGPETKTRINMLIQQAPVQLSPVDAVSDAPEAALDTPTWRILDPMTLEVETRIELRSILDAELSGDAQDHLRTVLDATEHGEA